MMNLHEIFLIAVTYIRSMWRFRWYSMILAWLIAIVAWIYIGQMPDVYTSSSKLYVDTESVLRPLMRGLALEGNISQRLKLLTKTLLSRPNMEKLARITDLDVTAKKQWQMDRLINRFQKNIQVKNNRRDPNLYEITYSHRDPKIAKKVVQGVLTIIVETTLGESRENSSTAKLFIDKQISEYEEKLLETEDKLKEFKTKNTSLMPTLRQGYFQSLQETTSILEKSELELKEAKNKRLELVRQMRGEEPVFGIIENSGSRHVSHPLDSKIKEFQDQKNELLLKYTELHPQVVSLDEKIKLLEAQKRGEVSAKETGVAIEPELDKNPVYQQIKISLAQTEALIAPLEVRVKEYKQKIEKLQKMVDTIPGIETEMKRLDRDYLINKRNYDALVSRRETAKLSANVEQTGDGIKIKIIEPPLLPRRPSGPKRKVFNSIAFVFSLAAGIGLAFVMSQFRPVFHDSKSLRISVGFPVLGAVSRIWTPEMLYKKKLEYGGFVGATAILLLAYFIIV